MWTVVRTANGQKKLHRLESISMARAMLHIVGFVRLATPFWVGESGTVFLYAMPQRTAIFSLQKHSAAVWNLINREAALFRDFMRKRVMKQEKSLMKRM